MSKENAFIEIGFSQKIKAGESISGDTCLAHCFNNKDRILLVLSDGLGSGVKAAVLSSLTASMSLRLFQETSDIVYFAETIMRTLPVCSVRKMSYSTLTLIEIKHKKFVRLIEYGNPFAIIFRGGHYLNLDRQSFDFEYPILGRQELFYLEFDLLLGDRIICFSDGVTQSGMGDGKFNFGWQLENVVEYVSNLLNTEPEIASLDLSEKIVSKSWANDSFRAQDDITCASVYCRTPRKLLIVTGPPYDKTKDSYIAHLLKNYDGKKIVCGGTTANIVARELNKEIRVDLRNKSDGLPPAAYMEGVDLVTEGVITLSRLFTRLCEINPTLGKANLSGNNLIDKMVLLILSSDIVEFLVGTRISEAHQSPDLPVELDIRRNIVRRIKNVLENKFLKEVRLEFV